MRLTPDALAQFYDSAFGEVYRYLCRAVLGNRALAEDVTQETFASVIAAVRSGHPELQSIVAANGYSFPSGHTCAAAASWSAIALVLGRDRSRPVHSALAAAASLIAVSVAASRALLGVHWLTDVIAGLVVGWGWFIIVAIIFGGRAQRLGDPLADRATGVQGVPSDLPLADGVMIAGSATVREP
ncbi:MAG TPA: phosphatase PAP2 family protein [Ilumatobacteraceae bacterium]|nr:phosphatase PAP2 family protein [Ilumatobacteraceae bacterium]